MKKIRHPLLLTLLLLGAALTLWSLWGTRAPMVSHVTVSSARLPAGWSGVRIAHISDLHNAQFGEENRRLLSLLEGTEPDLIAITGDLIDGNRTDVDVAVRFAEAAAELAPTFYVPGNHEASARADYEKLKEGLAAAGVRILEDGVFPLEQNGDTLWVMGLLDPRFTLRGPDSEVRAMVATKLQRLKEETGDGFVLLLSHRPELFSTYVASGMDLVLSGHAHGGQVRLPFVGGLVAPDQGFFPRYDAGLYTDGTTGMVVSRGIGNSIIPVRVNNRPEIVLVQLQRPQ